LHNKPKLLYKYCNDKSLPLLEKMRIIISPYEKLNDVHEFKATYDLEHMKKRLGRHQSEKGYLQNVIKNYKKIVGGNIISARQLMSKLPVATDAQINVICVKYGDNTVKKLFRHLKSEFLLLCLSAAQNHPLMWAHYCSSYTGFCLALDVGKMPGELDQVCEMVKYVEHPPVLKLDMGAKRNQPFSKAPFRSKHKCWRYEQEYRYVFKKTGTSPLFEKDDANDYLKIKPEYIHSVSLGPRISADNERKITEIVGRERIIKMKDTPGNYTLVNETDKK
jgi:Protein of unknown function (DUF2971)